MDEKLERVLKKQEYEFMMAYNISVKRKERELKEVILELQKEN